MFWDFFFLFVCLLLLLLFLRNSLPGRVIFALLKGVAAWQSNVFIGERTGCQVE